jgi:hypothetical protein
MDKPVENCPDLGMSMDDHRWYWTRIHCVLKCLYTSSTYKLYHRQPPTERRFSVSSAIDEQYQAHPILSATMTDKFTIATFAVNVVAAILAIPTFLIEGKALLSCFGKKRNCTSYQDLHCIKTSIFASNVPFLVWKQPTSLFCQHLPKTAIESATWLCITKRNSSVISMCAVRFGTGIMSFYPRIIAANICILLQSRLFWPPLPTVINL